MTRSGPALGSRDRRVLEAIAEAILPGAAALGAAEYVERLLSALESSPPRIFAGGPFSRRRHGREVGFLPLDRWQRAAWSLRLHGSRSLPAGGPNDAVLGPIGGLDEVVRRALALVVRLAPGVERWPPFAVRAVLALLPRRCLDPVVELVIEGALSAPEYGGNRGEGGWRAVQFEGDTAPRGHAKDAVSSRDPGPDPAPLTAPTRLLLAAVEAYYGWRGAP